MGILAKLYNLEYTSHVHTIHASKMLLPLQIQTVKHPSFLLIHQWQHKHQQWRAFPANLLLVKQHGAVEGLGNYGPPFTSSVTFGMSQTLWASISSSIKCRGWTR